MFEVIVRKPHADPVANPHPTESHRIVENKFHALNLARKIVLEDGTPWAEVTEVKGRFRALVTVEPDGTLSGHLTSGSRTYPVKRWGTPTWTSWLGMCALAFAVVTLIFGGIALIFPRDQTLLLVTGCLAGVSIVGGLAWVYVRRR